MKFRLILAGGVALLAASTAAPVLAAPGDHGEGFGGCVDNFYGNATNPRPDGNGILPSQSPGPFVNTDSTSHPGTIGRAG